jgi:alpha-amylase
LPAGSYCDVLHGDVVNGSCTGPVITVDGNGNAPVTVGGMDAVAIHAGSKVTGNRVQVSFAENATTSWGQNVYVVGSIPELGNWNPANAIALSSAGYPIWSASTSLPANIAFQYKYIKKNPDGSVTWESDPNRSASTGSGPLNLSDSWR